MNRAVLNFFIFFILIEKISATTIGVSPNELIFLENETVKQLNILSDGKIDFKISTQAPLEFSKTQGRINGITKIIVKKTTSKSFVGTILIESKAEDSPISIAPMIQVKVVSQGKNYVNFVLAGAIILLIMSYLVYLLYKN